VYCTPRLGNQQPDFRLDQSQSAQLGHSRQLPTNQRRTSGLRIPFWYCRCGFLRRFTVFQRESGCAGIAACCLNTQGFGCGLGRKSGGFSCPSKNAWFDNCESAAVRHASIPADVARSNQVKVSPGHIAHCEGRVMGMRGAPAWNRGHRRLGAAPKVTQFPGLCPSLSCQGGDGPREHQGGRRLTCAAQAKGAYRDRDCALAIHFDRNGHTPTRWP